MMDEETKETIGEIKGLLTNICRQLEDAEIKLRDIKPPVKDPSDPYGATSKDAADNIYSARDYIGEAADILDVILESSNTNGSEVK